MVLTTMRKPDLCRQTRIHGVATKPCMETILNRGSFSGLCCRGRGAEGRTENRHHPLNLRPQPTVPASEELKKLARTAILRQYRPDVRQRLRAQNWWNLPVNEGASCARPAREEHVEYDNPYDVGMTGLIGFPAASTP